jgi:hypothetical protein
MSSQRSLTEFDGRPAPGQDTRDVSGWRPRGTAQCVCGADVGAEAARIMGVHGIVPACPACYCRADGRGRYGTVRSAVVHFLDGTGYRTPDVEIDASLHPGVSE